MTELAQLKCVVCRGSEPTVTQTEIEEMHPQIPEWSIVTQDGIPHLERVFKFKNFIEAMAFTNKVAMISEKEDHHPQITTEWGRVRVQWWTHKIGGLHRNDFIMAARTDLLL